MLSLNQQHSPNFSGHLMAGEHAPIVLLLSLFVIGILTTVLDFHLWSALERRSPSLVLESKSPSVASTPITTPPLPPPAEKPSPPLDCPPLFSVSFALNGVKPHYKQADLDTLVSWLLAHPESMLIIDGHADSKGTSATNLALSQRRAEEMANKFVSAHLSFERITVRAFGQYVPLVGIPEQSSKNRRVVLRVTGTANCPTSEEL